MSLASAFAALLFVLPGLFGNAIFHADCRRRMTDALRSSADERDAAQTLLPVGGTRRRLTAIVLANAVLLALAFAAALQWMELANSAGSLPLASHRPGAEPLVTASVATPVGPSATHSAAPVASAQVAANIVVSTPQVPAIPVQAPGCDGCLRTVTGSNGRSVQGPVRSDPSVAATATGTTAKTPAPAGSKPAKVKASPSVAKAPEASADGTLRPYLINVGLFAVPSNAANAYDKLIESGLPATSQPLSTTKGPRTRVRVGPFETREQAREAVQRIQALALEAVIIQP
jgi:cell division septation protein DedD